MRPLLGEFAPPVDQIIEEGFFVRAEPREKNLIVRRREEVDVIDLHEAETPYRAANVARVHFSVRPRTVKALAGERDSPRLAQCEIFLGHLPFFDRAGQGGHRAKPDVDASGKIALRS